MSVCSCPHSSRLPSSRAALTKAAPNNYRIDRVSGAPSVIARRLATKQPRGHRCAAPRLLRFANEKQRAQRSGKPALSYPRERVSSGTRRGGARLAKSVALELRSRLVRAKGGQQRAVRRHAETSEPIPCPSLRAKRSNPGAAVRPSGLLAPRMLWPLDCFVARAPRNDGWVAADPIDSVVIGRRLRSRLPLEDGIDTLFVS
jgi:hypothetical protein